MINPTQPYLRHLIPLAILGIVILPGCSDRAEGDANSKPNISDVPPALRKPNVGSSYTFAISMLDSAGRVIDSLHPAVVADTSAEDSSQAAPIGGSSVETIRVVAVNGKFGGLDDVTAFQQGNDTSFVHYESNGDLSLATPDPVKVDGGWIWVRFPMSGSTRPDTASRLDTMIEKTPVRVALVSQYDGHEKMAVAGKIYDVYRAKVSFNTAYRLPSGVVVGGVEIIVWFAPEIGFIVCKEEQGIGADAYGTERGSVMKLVSYLLK